MNYRIMGNTGLKLSEIALGSWMTFSNQINILKSKKIIFSAFDHGINYFDTADVYSNGKAEIFLGKILPKNFRRQEYVVATKVFYPFTDKINDSGLSRKHITDSINNSLKRLKQDYIDIYYCHRFDEKTPLEETILTMNNLIHSGKILYWGISEWTQEQIHKAINICEKYNLIKPSINQPYYSLIYQNIEKKILPYCEKQGLGIASYSPLSQGILTGKYSGGKSSKNTRGSNNKLNIFMKANLENKDLLDRVDQLKPLAQKYNLTTAQFSIACLLQNKNLTSVIIGAKNIKQLKENVKSSEINLDENDLLTAKSLFSII